MLCSVSRFGLCLLLLPLLLLCGCQCLCYRWTFACSFANVKPNKMYSVQKKMYFREMLWCYYHKHIFSRTLQPIFRAMLFNCKFNYNMKINLYIFKINEKIYHVALKAIIKFRVWKILSTCPRIWFFTLHTHFFTVFFCMWNDGDTSAAMINNAK